MPKEQLATPEVRATKRRLHPWHDQLPDLAEGKGNFYHWGPNYTVDPIVITRGIQPSILLVRRGDTGDWALPGGFIDDGEDAATAARREVSEETSLQLNDDEPKLIYRGPVSDPRSTLYAWPETTALLWHIDAPTTLTAGDDAADAQWVPLASLPDSFYGSHAELIHQAIAEHGSTLERLALLGDVQETTATDSGHMGYRHYIISARERSIFLKQHDATHFTDVARAEHSRQYLAKEHSVYRQLASQIPHVSPYAELIDDNALALEAYTPEDGWYWRVPRDDTARQQYIRQIIDALQSLESLAFHDESPIRPTHVTLEREGWSDYAQVREKIIARLKRSRVLGSDKLCMAIDTLYAEHIAAETPTDTVFAHGDLRQSNIAWHPEHGVRIIDWSWAGPSAPLLDTTSFLIDLHKAGIDVGEFREVFSPYQARLLIGFWLHHSTWPSFGADDTVRAHQIASAVAAYELLERLSE